jgi:hypothetical protein
MLKRKSIHSQVDEEYNKIIIDNILNHTDLRTTLMIKNIPNKYTINTFLDEINVLFKNKYDLFYLPIDYNNKCNLGFAFINFVDSFHIILFYEIYRGKKWKRFNSEKICELLYAKIQGKKELISHFEKGKVLNFESEDKRPLILPTPEPLPQIEVPLKYLEKFLNYFPNANIKVLNDEGLVEQKKSENENNNNNKDNNNNKENNNKDNNNNDNNKNKDNKDSNDNNDNNNNNNDDNNNNKDNNNNNNKDNNNNDNSKSNNNNNNNNNKDNNINNNNYINNVNNEGNYNNNFLEKLFIIKNF